MVASDVRLIVERGVWYEWDDYKRKTIWQGTGASTCVTSLTRRSPDTSTTTVRASQWLVQAQEKCRWLGGMFATHFCFHCTAQHSTQYGGTDFERDLDPAKEVKGISFRHWSTIYL